MDATPTTNGVSGAAPIVLDDDPASTDLPGQQATSDTPAEAPKPEAPKAPDPDEAVLELSRRTREAQSAKKAAEARQKELDSYVAKHKSFETILSLAKTDPYAFVEKMAEAAGLDVDSAVEAFVTRKAGGQRELTEAERIARLEREREEERRANAEREEREKAERAKADGDAAVKRHVDQIKSLAEAAKDNFPLFNDEEFVEGNALAAFDLMVLAHEQGKELSYAAAVHQIEKTLREDTERRATRLGYQKANGASQPPKTPTAQVTASPRPTQASAAPIEATQTIKSDEDIAAEWLGMFRRS